MELTKTKLNKILKKYKIELEKLDKDWQDTCKKVRMRNTETHIALPTIYEHERHNSKGSQLFKNLMKEFEGYEVFPKKTKGV